ncbi:GNAT family N-acetyltransferase [Vibrio quintilis]|uniref:Acetyltransferase (GNAT) family protein n=1 Tax=Vibrio quintilis TaxID=1117707 RepID=A0A1M7YZE4_9VIBR|nr:GNAT family N-acetyltransferase [Vibrio quintilis]SHO57922.1 Acetyltransferase (GNAT) family protein [Vibrio quintilis]
MKISLLADCPEQAAQVAQWYFDEWAHKDPESTLDRVKQKVALSMNHSEIPIAFVVHIEDELAGAGEIKYRELPDYPGLNYWLDGIYVPVKLRGKGISTALIEYARQKAHEFALPSLNLRCEAHNVKLYEKHGFEVVYTEQHKSIMSCAFDGLK